MPSSIEINNGRGTALLDPWIDSNLHANKDHHRGVPMRNGVAYEHDIKYAIGHQLYANLVLPYRIAPQFFTKNISGGRGSLTSRRHLTPMLPSHHLV